MASKASRRRSARECRGVPSRCFASRKSLRAARPCAGVGGSRRRTRCPKFVAERFFGQLAPAMKVRSAHGPCASVAARTGRIGKRDRAPAAQARGSRSRGGRSRCRAPRIEPSPIEPACELHELMLHVAHLVERGSKQVAFTCRLALLRSHRPLRCEHGITSGDSGESQNRNCKLPSLHPQKPCKSQPHKPLQNRLSLNRFRRFSRTTTYT
jgi:hypothetical protein